MALGLYSIAEGKQVQIPSFDLVAHLGFTNCTMTQDERQHHTKKWGSMYGVDIKCPDHENVSIVWPKYLTGGQYRVSRVWYDKYLWDYITIDFTGSDKSTMTLVYWHTQTTLKPWDRLKQWELIGKYKASGKTTWPHTHIELWKWGKNITFDMLKTNDKSNRLQIQRWRVTEEKPSNLLFDTMNFILPNEWLRLTAYHDWWSRYSIWYWTPSHKWEVITHEEAWKRFEKATQKRLVAVQEMFPNKTHNQYIALTSYYYNCPSQVKHMSKNWITKARRMKCITAGGKKLTWLEKRRQKEWNKYNEGAENKQAKTQKKSCRSIIITVDKGEYLELSFGGKIRKIIRELWYGETLRICKDL